MQGRTAEAKRWLENTPPRFRRTPAYRVAIAETLAQAEFAHGDFEGALNILDEADVDGNAHLGWYRISIAITKTHILLAKGDRTNAKRCAAEAIPIAQEFNNCSAERMLQLLATEASLGDTPPAELTQQLSDWDNDHSIELQAAASLYAVRLSERLELWTLGPSVCGEEFVY